MKKGGIEEVFFKFRNLDNGHFDRKNKNEYYSILTTKSFDKLLSSADFNQTRLLIKVARFHLSHFRQISPDSKNLADSEDWCYKAVLQASNIASLRQLYELSREFGSDSERFGLSDKFSAELDSHLTNLLKKKQAEIKLSF